MECPVNVKDDQSPKKPAMHPPVKSGAVPPPECPVSMNYVGKKADAVSGWLGAMFGSSSSSSSGTPMNSVPNSSSTNKDGVVGYNAAANDIAFNQERRPEQTHNMSVKRTLSGIPKADYTPAHQPTKDSASGAEIKSDHWVYPSEQQYYNAMKKKGYNPPEQDIGAILAIHNMVNETGWQLVKEWEAFRGNLSPKLKRFEGKPQVLSPKARFLTWVGVPPPFDRHDWIVDRGGQEVRYVIDFHNVPHNSGAHGVPVHMDVRPALDSPQALLDRLEIQFRQRFMPDSLKVIKAATGASGAGSSHSRSDAKTVK